MQHRKSKDNEKMLKEDLQNGFIDTAIVRKKAQK